MNHDYTATYHLKAFATIAEFLAGYTDQVVSSQRAKFYDKEAPILCTQIQSDDVITERKMVSLKVEQLRLFD